MKTRLFKIAHSIKQHFATFSEALTYAWKVIKLGWSMLVGSIKFQYKKVDGSIRQAVGTLDVDYKRVGDKPSNFSLFTYWDLEANGWRSCKVENLIF